MTIDELGVSIANKTNNPGFAAKVVSIIIKDHNNSWKEQLDMLTMITTDNDEHTSFYISSKFEVYSFTHYKENTDTFICNNIGASTIKRMYDAYVIHSAKNYGTID